MFSSIQANRRPLFMFASVVAAGGLAYMSRGTTCRVAHKEKKWDLKEQTFADFTFGSTHTITKKYCASITWEQCSDTTPVNSIAFINEGFHTSVRIKFAGPTGIPPEITALLKRERRSIEKYLVRRFRICR